MHLNPMQREAVMATEGPLLILAGAGSGKTTVLINRIYNILMFGSGSDSDYVPEWADGAAIDAMNGESEDAARLAAVNPCPPWQILAITFTNKAADELKSRLSAMLGPEGQDVWALTFHSACLRILRRDCEKLGYTSDFSIYDTSDTLSLVKRILKDNDIDDKKFSPKAMLSYISNIKDRMLTPDQFSQIADFEGDLYKKMVSKIYREYARRLFEADAMDFDDLILNTVRLFEEYGDVLEYWQHRFRYVLIDEYQDTNAMQFRFSELISGGRHNICVVGDDDQSIYKFRGATIENILTFEDRNPHCRTIRLEQNYRSTGTILDAANAVIRNNTERKGKELWTDHEKGDLIELYVAENEHEEAQYVAGQILKGYSQGENFRDYAVLYRKNAQSSSIEFALKRNGIPYRIYGGMKFFERAEIKDILSYLCVILSPNDNLRLERIINNPPRGIGAKSIETASEIAIKEGTYLFDVISRADLYPELSRPAIRMREFSNMINELKYFAQNNPPDAVFDELLNKTGYVRVLEEKNTIEDAARIENVKELKSGIISYMEESGDNTLAGYLASVALYTDLDNMDRDDDCVTLMTMHSSKGLEFPHVFLVGMEETIFPGAQALGDSTEMEEERRLAYVAITRAMKTVNLVCAMQRMIFGQTTSNRISRFVEEIPEELRHANVIPRGYAFSDRAGSSYRMKSESGFGADYNQFHGGSSYGSSGQRGYSQIHSSGNPDRPGSSIVLPAKKAEPAVISDINEGDRIKHRAFGEGTVVKLSPMGGDYLIEMAFDKVGTKKLMLKAAAQYIEKI